MSTNLKMKRFKALQEYTHEPGELQKKKPNASQLKHLDQVNPVKVEFSCKISKLSNQKLLEIGG